MSETRGAVSSKRGPNTTGWSGMEAKPASAIFGVLLHAVARSPFKLWHQGQTLCKALKGEVAVPLSGQ